MNEHSATGAPVDDPTRATEFQRTAESVAAVDRDFSDEARRPPLGPMDETIGRAGESAQPARLPTPAVGRTVLFYPGRERLIGGEPIRDRKGGQPFPAVITHVWHHTPTSTLVNLNVLADGSFGEIGNVTSVQLFGPVGASEPLPAGDFAAWPIVPPPPPPPVVAEVAHLRERIRALTGKVGILQAQVLGMLADYYEGRREGTVARIGAADKAIAEVAPAVSSGPAETEEQAADRRAKARRGIIPPDVTAPGPNEPAAAD